MQQENNEQFESLQVQELSKVKQLVLLREQELSEKSGALKDANVQLEKLRNEVNRLRRQEEQLSDIQVIEYMNVKCSITIVIFCVCSPSVIIKNDYSTCLY